MKFNNTKTIAIDSNILTYYVDATTPRYTPTIVDDKIEQLDKERVATFQIPMYAKWFAILPAVRAEYRKIK
jgi:hypothetical protein